MFKLPSRTYLLRCYIYNFICLDLDVGSTQNRVSFLVSHFSASLMAG